MILQHYIKIAFRNLAKYKVQSAISIVGLAIGLICFTYGWNWYRYETNYDGFYPQSEQIYRIYGIDKQTGKKSEELPLILARKLKKGFPGSNRDNADLFQIRLDFQIWRNKVRGSGRGIH